MRRLPLYLTFNAALAAAVACLILAAFASGSSEQARQTTLLDQALTTTIEDWANRGVPPEERLLTILVREPLTDAGLLESSPRPGLASLLLRIALRDGLGPEAGSETLSGALTKGTRPFLDWKAESILWNSAEKTRAAALVGHLARAHQAGARITVVSQGHGAELALEALAAARGRATAEKLLILGRGRNSLQKDPGLRAYLERPANVRETACVWAQGLSPMPGKRSAGSVQLELLPHSGLWTRVSGNALLIREEGGTSFSEEDLLRALAELGRSDQSMEEALLLSGVLAPNATGAWKGRYHYPALRKDGTPYNKAPVEFSAKLSQVGERLEGLLSEPQTFGPVPAGILKSYLVNGLVDRAGNVRFIKKYDGSGGVEHAVTYKGTLARDGKVMEGTWLLLNGSEGRFELVKVLEPAATRPGP